MTIPALAVLAAVVAALPSAPAAPACDVTGTWGDNFGTTFLRMTPGGSVSGNYTWQNGTLSGILDGPHLNGTWREEPTFEAPRDAGTFSWTFSADCSSFDGTYSYAESPGASAGSWYGARSGAQSPSGAACDPAGFWETDLGGMLFSRDEDDLQHHRGTFSTGAAFGEMSGPMSGLLWRGDWSTTPTSDQPIRVGRYAIEFDAHCESFVGTWTEFVGTDATTLPWTGRASGETGVVTPRAPSPTPPDARPDGSVAGTPATPPPDPDLIDEAVEAEPNEGDPLGIPMPGAVAVLLAAVVAALALRARGRPPAR